MFSDNWCFLFEKIKKKKYAKSLKNFLDNEYLKYIIYPNRGLIFNAFKQTPPDKIKVVIIGQDPYYRPKQAMGLAFSVPEFMSLPPSLINIFKEIENEYKCKMNYSNGDLSYLAKQGCLLLNTILTVRDGKPLSHNIEEYKLFTKDVLQYIDSLDSFIVFMLWGNYAKQYIKYIKNKKRLILTCVHPSPQSALKGGWFNNNHFKKADYFLSKHNMKTINWLNNKKK